MTKIEKADFEAFKRYARGMLTEIANAKIGQFHDALHIQEAIIVWKAEEGMPLDYYPMPENITHIKTDPLESFAENGCYAFRNTLRALFEKLGANNTKQPLLSCIGNNEFELVMRQKGGNINELFIRYNGNLKEKMDDIANINKDQLHEACIKGCKASCVDIDLPDQPILNA